MDVRSSGSTLVNTSRVPTNTTALPNYDFNPNLFAHPAYGSFGDFGRGVLHAPGINNTDLLLAKRIQIRESSRAELRLEGYNVFNHTQFSAPSVNFNSSNFGRVTSAASGRIVQLGVKFYF